MSRQKSTRGERTWIERELFERGWSMRQFAERIGVVANYGYLIAKGRKRPSTEVCQRIAEVFEMTEAEVLRRFGHMSALPADLEEAEEVSLLELFRLLTADEREQVLQYARFLYREEKG